MLSSLRDFGLGKKTTESMIQEEVHHLCRFFEEEGEGGKKSVDASLALTQASTNVICSLVLGQRCGSGKEFEQIATMLQPTRQSGMPLLFIFLMRYR